MVELTSHVLETLEKKTTNTYDAHDALYDAPRIHHIPGIGDWNTYVLFAADYVTA